ncbi:uncharacterized protein LOC117106209 [Anneissia japonica]|uniref:uncharacterized protein LOC117106209 n=1 Tax=Anneissia japonica TaxID=1529436 RepID=UPI001425A492|nr:uncharacterized protein LOC117106209 [Anneissia japonica]
MPPKKRKLMPPAPKGKCRLLLEERYREIPVDAEDLLNGHVVLKFMQESKLFAPTTKFFAEHMGLQITKNKIQLLVNRTIKKYTHMNREKEVSMLIANCDEKYKHEKKQQEPGTSAEQAVRRKLTQTTSQVTVTPSTSVTGSPSTVQNGIKSYSCNICNRLIKYSANGIKSYNCSIYNRLIKYSANGIKSHSCNICNRLIKYSANSIKSCSCNISVYRFIYWNEVIKAKGSADSIQTTTSTSK